MMKGHIQIWFFSGILLLIYGVLITATGLWELSHPLANPPVLNGLHAPIWWGALMVVAGLFYTLKFRPR
ncbi:MAG TPA: hypothetical protein VHE33_18025 [Acidobacteriaceae bacterium]|nr:hypothetical protein [Acidobacteriaceae bacterium]